MRKREDVKKWRKLFRCKNSVFVKILGSNGNVQKKYQLSAKAASARRKINIPKLERDVRVTSRKTNYLDNFKNKLKREQLRSRQNYLDNFKNKLQSEQLRRRQTTSTTSKNKLQSEQLRRRQTTSTTSKTN